MIKENMYGHAKRLEWIISYVKKQECIVEFGCGTGCMISRPLSRLGYFVYGVDLDQKSILFGQQVFGQEGLNSDNLRACDLAELDVDVDVIVASEVIEHIHDEEMEPVFRAIHQKLKPNGQLLVTVPNGYGWFELENFFYNKAGFGRVIELIGLSNFLLKAKAYFLGSEILDKYPSTLADSPHVQWFSFDSIQELLIQNGFEVTETNGTVLFAGPFSNLFFGGIKSIMRLNCKLGSWFPRLAAGFLITAKKKD
jgi:2-polyprenyl-3-methyl-5-hydroxy-6-metoxy-1,4-benzoquinol methylase